MSQMLRCQTRRFGLRQVRSTFCTSASNQSTWLANSGSAVQPSGSKPNEPGRKSTPRFMPSLARSRSWISGLGSPTTILGSSMAGTAELHHVSAEVVCLDDGGQRPALAQRGHVPRHRDMFEHAARLQLDYS